MRGRTQDDGSTPKWSRHDFWGVQLDSPDVSRLARFYSELLGWDVYHDDGQDATITPPDDSVTYLGFQTNADYVRPTWPPAEGRQQMMMHLDFEVDDLAAAVEHALELGAEQADVQPQDNVRVMLDPDGHPFCLYADPSSSSS